MYYISMFPTRRPADFQDYLDKLLANLAQPRYFDAANALGNSSR
jgi:hypothetical protein